MDLRQKVTASGFTLIEVTLAILILAGALVVLLGLQSSSVERTIRDQNQQRAMLVARRILSALEVESEPPEPSDRDMSLNKLLEEYVTLDDKDKNELDQTKDFQAHLKIENWQIPQIEKEDAIRKISLSIYWGNSGVDTLNIVYFIPGNT